MIINPGIIALLLLSAITAIILLYSAAFGLLLLRRWDLRSGSQSQIVLERKTYLVSTLVSNILGFEVLALFLFIQTAERLHTLFVGAMCAAGTLYVNPYGYPALLVRVALAALAGLWLVLNRLDEKAPDYPIIRLKYSMLLVLAPLALASAVLSWLYLTGLRADVITSCCGTLFSRGSEAVRAEVEFSGTAMVSYIYTATTLALFLCGLIYLVRGRGAALYSMLSFIMLPLGLLSLTLCVSPYIYELPTHRCPFCMLQSDYNYIGYPIYASLLLGSVLGMGAGAAGILRGRLLSIDGGPEWPRRRLTAWSLFFFGVFTLLVLWSVLSSNLSM